MSTTSIKIVASLLVLLAVVSEAGILPHLIHIEVINWLYDNLDLTLHCYERKGKDLGEQILPPLGRFNFSFRPRMIGKSTKYYCSFKWSGSNLKWFDLYSHGRDYNACRNCTWVIRKRDVCRYIEYGRGGTTYCLPF